MLELIRMYQWVILGGASMGLLLVLLGNHLATRDRAMQTVCISQGALLGVLLALGFFGVSTDQEGHQDPYEHLIPLLGAIVFSSVIYVKTEWLSVRRIASRNALFAAVFAVLLSLSHFVSAIFPGLESHLSQIYFGDLATLTEWDAQFSFYLGIAGLAVMKVFHRSWTRDSFEIATFGETVSEIKSRKSRVLFYGMTLFALCFSVLFLGFLFTIGCLFLPTVMMSFSQRVGLRGHVMGCLGIALMGILGGFGLSLWQTRWPTVPVILLCQFTLGGFIILVNQRKNLC